MAVIWDFEPTTGMTGAAIQPEEKPADHMVSVPRLAFDEVSCNCTQFPSVGDIVRTPDTGAIAARLQNLDLSGIPDACGDTDDENDKESEEEGTRDESNSEAEEELFTELMQLKGSSYHDSFQSSLKKCKERLLEKEKNRSPFTIRTHKRSRRERYSCPSKFVCRRRRLAINWIHPCC